MAEVPFTTNIAKSAKPFTGNNPMRFFPPAPRRAVPMPLRYSPVLPSSLPPSPAVT
jgi:hypothetical protein